MTDSPVLRSAADRDAHAAARRIARALLAGLGLLLILLGIVIAPLPGPMGVPVMAVGLMILLRNSFWAKRRFVKLHRRHPRTVGPMRRLMRPGTPVLAVLWQQTLKLERLILPSRLRALRGVRRRTRKRSGDRAR
jgi:Flp pilus assembly protein TadB